MKFRSIVQTCIFFCQNRHTGRCFREMESMFHFYCRTLYTEVRHKKKFYFTSERHKSGNTYKCSSDLAHMTFFRLTGFLSNNMFRWNAWRRWRSGGALWLWFLQILICPMVARKFWQNIRPNWHSVTDKNKQAQIAQVNFPCTTCVRQYFFALDDVCITISHSVHEGLPWWN